MNRYYRIGVCIGAVDTRAPIDPYADPTPLPAKSDAAINAARQEGITAATSYASQPGHKRYVGFARLNNTPEIEPVDQVLGKHSDDANEMEKWISLASSDPMYLWAGYFDTATGHLIRESTGKVIEVKPTPAPSGHGVAIGLFGAILTLALVAKH